MFFILVVVVSPFAQSGEPLAGTAKLDWTGDLSAKMVVGIDKFLTEETEKSVAGRARFWKRDLSSPAAYDKSVEHNRERLRRIIGAVDKRVSPVQMQVLGEVSRKPMKKPVDLGGPDNTREPPADLAPYVYYRVRWTVLDGLSAEGILIQPSMLASSDLLGARPASKPKAFAVLVPPSSQTPEMLARGGSIASMLAQCGCQVLIPTTISRERRWSGNESLGRRTEQTHREWIYRQAFELGRHVIGYEVQKVLAAVDWFDGRRKDLKEPILLFGLGDGGQTALYSAALDRRVEGVYVDDYFDAREELWQQPIDQNQFGLLRELGDAEVASLVAPRKLIASMPADDFRKAENERADPHWTPGNLRSIGAASSKAEVQRAAAFFPTAAPWILPIPIHLISERFSQEAGATLDAVGIKLGMDFNHERFEWTPIEPTDSLPKDQVDPTGSQRRQLKEMVDFTQKLLRESERTRRDYWKNANPKSLADWQRTTAPYREALRNEVIGSFDNPKLPPNARSRLIKTTPKYRMYEVVLDVWQDVFAWGYLLVPTDVKEGERRPVVVCQHGLEGVPEDVVTEDPKSTGCNYYRAFAVKLAERGFVTFAPHNPYRGHDKFRVLQRKANPLGKSLFSIIVGQHEVITDWLASQPFVDPKRIGFYGLSYGGKTAMRVPALVDRYCLSICSADFNDWIRKCVTVDDEHSYMFTGEYEMPEWNLGNTFNYAEMAALIAPRPFMVERGHHDGVAPDEWVAYEYAKVRRLYVQLGIGDRTEIEFFDGPHRINGVGTFAFLHKHLKWPEKR